MSTVTGTPGLVLRPAAPEAVWLEAVGQDADVPVTQMVIAGAPCDPEAINCAEPWGPEVVVELELEEQPPELPLTPV